MPSGRHHVVVRKDLHNEYDSWVSVLDSQREVVQAALGKDFGVLRFEGSPKGARVEVDGAYMGQIPLNFRLKPGSHRVMVTQKDHDSLDETVYVAVGDDTRREVTLAPHLATVRLFATPPDAMLYLDGKYLGRSPQICKDQPVGEHRVRAELKEYGPVEQEFTLGKNQVRDLNLELSRTAYLQWNMRHRKAIIQSSILPGLGQTRYGQSRGIVYMAVAATGVWLAMDGLKAYDESATRYDEERHLYASAITQVGIDMHYAAWQEAYSDMESAAWRHRAGLAMVGGAWLVSVVDALWKGGGSLDGGRAQLDDEHKLALQPVWRKDQVALELRIHP